MKDAVKDTMKALWSEIEQQARTSDEAEIEICDNVKYKHQNQN